MRISASSPTAGTTSMIAFAATFPDGTAYVFAYKSGTDLIEKIWYPNETAPYMNAGQRTVDVASVTSNASPRYQVEYDKDGLVTKETVGDDPTTPTVGGSYTFSYDDRPSRTNLVDGSSLGDIVFEATRPRLNGRCRSIDLVREHNERIVGIQGLVEVRLIKIM